MVHPAHCFPAGEPSRAHCGRKYPSSPLFRSPALLDSTALDLESGRKRAGDVGSLGIACDGGHLCLVAASRRAPVPEDVSRAVGAVTVPTPTCPHGALVQHAASPGIGGDLHRTTVGRGASKLEAAPRICWFERRTSLYALPFWTG